MRLLARRIITADIIPKVAKLKAVSQWVPGQSGNPKGRPKDVRTIQVLKNDLELAVREHLSPTKVTQVINRMVEIATKSRDPLAAVAAGKVVLTYAISKPHVQEQGQSRTGFTIVIENATLQALQKPIDAEYKQLEVDDNGGRSETDQ